MKTPWYAALIVALGVGLGIGMAPPADAKRLGGGKAAGMQRDMPARTAPDAPAPKPATPAAPTQAAPTQGAAAAGAAAAPGRSWLGPIAGLAAGLGLAALMSHLGLGEAFANFLMIALLAIAAIVLVRFLLRRFAPQRGMQYAAAPAAGGPSGHATPPATAGAGAGASASGAPAAPTVAMPPETLPAPAAAAAPAVAKAFVPATFDHEGFERVAKMIFIRMQAANDTADLEDLRNFTTPEMFAGIRLDLQERGPAAQTTDVVAVDAKVLDVTEADGRQIVSVRYTGRLREEAGGPLVDFDEVWHLVKPLDDSRGWAIAGIEQMA